MIFNLLQAGDTELLETGVEAVAQAKTMNLIDMALAGGWLMLVLLILSVMAIYIFGNKWWMIRKAGKIDRNFMKDIRDMIHDGKIKSALALCQKYDSVAGKRQWFFQKWDGTPYETSWYNRNWRQLIVSSGIPWRGTPRPYDLRHAFASRNIIRWMECGKDVMELLPYLSAYMGHAELTSTLYYIHLLPEKLRRAKGIDWEKLSMIYGKEVPEDED